MPKTRQGRKRTAKAEADGTPSSKKGAPDNLERIMETPLSLQGVAVLELRLQNRGWMFRRFPGCDLDGCDNGGEFFEHLMETTAKEMRLMGERATLIAQILVVRQGFERLLEQHGSPEEDSPLYTGQPWDEYELHGVNRLLSASPPPGDE